MRVVIPQPGAVIGGAVELVFVAFVGVMVGVLAAVVVWASVVVALGAVAWASTVDGLHRLRPAVRRMLRRAR